MSMQHIILDSRMLMFLFVVFCCCCCFDCYTSFIIDRDMSFCTPIKKRTVFFLNYQYNAACAYFSCFIE